MIQTSEKQESSQSPTPHTAGSGSSGGESSEPATCSTSAGVVEANTSSNDAQYPPDVKVGFDELCPVCGDKVSGYHYGLLTCESCKGFFKRTVQNKKVYSCVDNRSCHIDKSQRKRCPFCRFQKCLQVGMKLEAVRSDRMRGGRNKFGPMYKRDRALKQQAARQATAMYAQCQMHLTNGSSLPSTTEAPELKPDPALLIGGSASIPCSLSSSSPVRGGSSPLSCPPNAGSPGAGASVRPPTTSTSPVPRGHSFYGQGAAEPYLLAPSYPMPMGLRMYPGSHPHQMVSPGIPQLLVDLKHNLIEDIEVKQKLLTFIQSEFGQASMSQPGEMLHLVCKLVDQLLFLMVEWARNCIFFKEMKVEDQMKLLQNCWSEILILDLVHRHVHQSWGSEVMLSNGQKISLDLLDDFGLSDIKGRMLELMKKFKDLQIDANEYLCLKFLILLNPDVPGLENKQHVEQSQERVNAALLEYCLNFYSEMKDKFGQVLLRLPEIRVISIRSEEFLYCKHLNSEIPDQTLLMEMLHSKKK